ncbi:hypothetical protein GCM10009850_102870 [Nonomuraea monospora]|uniref:DUF4158 domain-containing protein n=1 Tax=Nonomuraea monospora TaxID=568818 RepID=A0ABN3CZ72_9ACTN
MTVRYLGCFLADPLEVPNEVLDEVLDVVAAQLHIDDPSCVKRYTERDKTRLEHTWEIAKAFGLKDFASAEAELAGKVRAHAWNTGDGPTACFQYAVRWLRQNDVLLPGISTLTRLVARERERATRELHDTLAALPSATPWCLRPVLGERDDDVEHAVGGRHGLGVEGDGAPAPGDAGQERGQIRRARLMQVDLDAKRVRHRGRRCGGVEPHRLTGAAPQEIVCFGRGERLKERIYAASSGLPWWSARESRSRDGGRQGGRERR